MATRGQLPAYFIDNAMVNFQPLASALDGYREGLGVAGKSTAQINAANAMQAGDFERAASETARSGDVAGAMSLRRHPGEMRAQEDAARTRETQMMAGRAQELLSITDPTQRRTRATEWFGSDPRFARAIQARGGDPNDIDGVLNGIVSEARGYRDPDEAAQREAQTGLIRAQTTLAQSQAALGGRDPHIQRYNYYTQQEQAAGRTPRSFNEWELDQRRAGATAITVDQRGENAFATTAGQQTAKQFTEIVENANASREQMADLHALRDLGSRVTTGVPAELMRQFGPYAEALGIKIDGLGPAQAYQAIVDRMAPRMRVAGAGPTSDFDARQFLRSLPQLATSPEGNQLILNTFEALQQHRLRSGEIASRALAGEITPREAQIQIRQLPDPWTAYRQSTGRAPTAPQQGQQPPPQQPQQAQQPNVPTDPASALSAARAAIARGANRSAVEQRLRDAGIDPSGL